MSTYPLRIADHVMEEARRAAQEDNVSLNQLFATFIADGIGHRRAILAMKRRAEKGDVAAALSLLDRVPDHPPEKNDRLRDAG